MPRGPPRGLDASLTTKATPILGAPLESSCLFLEHATAPLGGATGSHPHPCPSAKGFPRHSTQPTVPIQWAWPASPIHIAPAGGGQVLGAREGTAVLTLMLSCQRWAFWKFSAASASLCEQSAGRSEAEEGPPSRGRNAQSGRVPHSSTFAHRPPLPTQAHHRRPCSGFLSPFQQGSPSLLSRRAWPILWGCSCEHSCVSVHLTPCHPARLDHTMWMRGDRAVPALPSQSREGHRNVTGQNNQGRDS